METNMFLLTCFHCNKDVRPVIESVGPHLKAICSECGRYIKHLNKDQKRLLEIEEDKKADDTRTSNSYNT